MPECDAKLVDRFIKTGDAEAYAEIVKLHSAMVYAVCHRILRDQARAEDVCQETFLHLLRKAKSVTGSLSCWLHTTATWKAIDEIRQDASRKEREADYVVEKPLEISSWEEISPCIDQALTELPEQERQLLIEHFLEGKSQSDLAQDAGTSQATISRKMDSALKQVRKHLEKRGITVGAVALFTFFRENMVEAASQHLIEELGKTAILAGAKATLPQAIWGLRFLKISLKVLIPAAVLGFILFSFSGLPERSQLRSVHFTAQSRNNDPNAPSSTSKGAYEQWFYFPEGADGPVMMRMQRWDPKVTYKMCSWLQNENGNYYFHAGEQKLYITNYRLWIGDLRIRRLPTDAPEFISKLNEIEGPISEIDYVRDETTGYLVKTIDHRFVDVPNFQTKYEYDTLTQDFFNYNWPANIEVVDQRDSIHKQGWTYFKIEGQIGDEKIEGVGCLPLVYKEMKTHPPWLTLKFEKGRQIIDCPDGASSQNTSEKISLFPKGFFFHGLSRPWMGMHTIDIIRRDAVENGISIDINALDENEENVEITLSDNHGYAHTRITYRINMEKDLIESISFMDSKGAGPSREGMVRFIYLDKDSQPTSEFVEPTIKKDGIEIAQINPGTFWLLDFAKGQLK